MPPFVHFIEYTLTIDNIQGCLQDNVGVGKWKILREELKIPPPHIAVGEGTLVGIKIWVLTDANATWQKLAIALYNAALNGALKDLKTQYLLTTGM